MQSNQCATCQHTPGYCRCEPVLNGGPGDVIVATADPAATAKGRLLMIADMLDQDGLAFFSGEIRGNLEAALETARADGHADGFELGYAAAKDSVGEWLERLKP